MREVLALSSVLLLVACGGRPGLGGGDWAAADGGASGDACEQRTPVNHRPTGIACPQQRGPGAAAVDSCALDGGRIECVRDADCTRGANGRCFSARLVCTSFCQYDTCFGDAECSSGQPCACRASAADSAANSCATASNCRVDADCGPCGACSPSLLGQSCECMSAAFCEPGSGSCSECGPDGCREVPCQCGDSCGHGYFCHTPDDGCLNDGDCSAGNTCNYDLPSQSWRCTGCMPRP